MEEGLFHLRAYVEALSRVNTPKICKIALGSSSLHGAGTQH